MNQQPGVVRIVRIGSDEPVHVPDEVIDALRARERDGVIDLPNEKRGRKNPRVEDRVRIVSAPHGSLRPLHAGIGQTNRRPGADVQSEPAGEAEPRRGRVGVTSGHRCRVITPLSPRRRSLVHRIIAKRDRHRTRHSQCSTLATDFADHRLSRGVLIPRALRAAAVE